MVDEPFRGPPHDPAAAGKGQARELIGAAARHIKACRHGENVGDARLQRRLELRRQDDEQPQLVPAIQTPDDGERGAQLRDGLELSVQLFFQGNS